MTRSRRSRTAVAVAAAAALLAVAGTASAQSQPPKPALAPGVIADGVKIGHGRALELIATIGALRSGIVPPTINFTEADPECDLDVTPNTARLREVPAAISNAFAFGGLNAVLALRRA